MLARAACPRETRTQLRSSLSQSHMSHICTSRCAQCSEPGNKTGKSLPSPFSRVQETLSITLNTHIALSETGPSSHSWQPRNRKQTTAFLIHSLPSCSGDAQLGKCSKLLFRGGYCIFQRDRRWYYRHTQMKNLPPQKSFIDQLPFSIIGTKTIEKKQKRKRSSEIAHLLIHLGNGNKSRHLLMSFVFP